MSLLKMANTDSHTAVESRTMNVYISHGFTYIHCTHTWRASLLNSLYSEHCERGHDNHVITRMIRREKGIPRSGI